MVGVLEPMKLDKLSAKFKGIMVGINILPGGICNLVCPSCPVGNSTFRATEMMGIELFRSILSKLQAETKVREVWLGGYSEPLLHPCPQVFVSEIRARGLTAYVSTNLTITKNLEDVVDAKPTRLRVSVSGFTQKFYGYYHGGDIEIVKDNMRLLSRIRKNVPVSVFLSPLSRQSA